MAAMARAGNQRLATVRFTAHALSEFASVFHGARPSTARFFSAIQVLMTLSGQPISLAVICTGSGNRPARRSRQIVGELKPVVCRTSFMRRIRSSCGAITGALWDFISSSNLPHGSCDFFKAQFSADDSVLEGYKQTKFPFYLYPLNFIFFASSPFAHHARIF